MVTFSNKNINFPTKRPLSCTGGAAPWPSIYATGQNTGRLKLIQPSRRLKNDWYIQRGNVTGFKFNVHDMMQMKWLVSNMYSWYCIWGFGQNGHFISRPHKRKTSSSNRKKKPNYIALLMALLTMFNFLLWLSACMVVWWVIFEKRGLLLCHEHTVQRAISRYVGAVVTNALKKWKRTTRIFRVEIDKWFDTHTKAW